MMESEEEDEAALICSTTVLAYSIEIVSKRKQRKNKSLDLSEIMAAGSIRERCFSITIPRDP